jgi:hypothetical protein
MIVKDLDGLESRRDSISRARSIADKPNEYFPGTVFSRRNFVWHSSVNNEEKDGNFTRAKAQADHQRGPT